MKMWQATAFVVGTFGLSALIGACDETEPGQSSGSGAGSGTSTGSAGGAVTECGDAADNALEGNCRDCANTSCCAELAACDTDACVQRLTCEVLCGDVTSCRDECATTHPDGGAATAVTACLALGCTVCAPPSAVCGGELSIGSPACDSCITDNCCTQVEACLLDADCKDCVESGEPDQCDMNTVYADTVTCFDDNCATPCGG